MATVVPEVCARAWVVLPTTRFLLFNTNDVESPLDTWTWAMISTVLPEYVVDVNVELFYRYQSTFDLSLSDFKKLMRKWLSINLELPEDIKVDFG